MNGRASFDRLRDDIEAIKNAGTSHDLYRLRDLLLGEYTRLDAKIKLDNRYGEKKDDV